MVCPILSSMSRNRFSLRGLPASLTSPSRGREQAQGRPAGRERFHENLRRRQLRTRRRLPNTPVNPTAASERPGHGGSVHSSRILAVRLRVSLTPTSSAKVSSTGPRSAASSRARCRLICAVDSVLAANGAPLVGGVIAQWISQFGMCLLRARLSRWDAPVSVRGRCRGRCRLLTPRRRRTYGVERCNSSA